MPVFQRHDPDLGSLIAYIVARSRDRDITLTQTKLVKLLYLIDVERAAEGRQPLTGLRWTFYHYGPYPLELPGTIGKLESQRRLVTENWHDSKLYRAAPNAPDGDDWNHAARRTVDSVIRRYAAMDLNELLDFVYFRTGPMKGAARGETLDLGKAKTDAPPRRQPPLSPPTLRPDAGQRLQAAKEQRARQLVPAPEPRSFFRDEDDERLPVDSAHGFLAVESEEHTDT